jgi:RNA recognition motif-containing protein
MATSEQQQKRKKGASRECVTPETKQESMTNKVFVGGLSWDTSDEGLRTAFERFGDVVEAKVITDRDTGRSRGFGFVTFTDSSAAQAAIQEMDGTSLDGRSIRVNEAQDRRGGGGPRGGGPPRDDRGRGGRGGRGRGNW